MNIFTKIGQKIRQFLSGRYGGDKLNIFLLVLYVALILLNSFIGALDSSWSGVLIFPAIIVIAIALFRALSRNISKRAAENQKFMAFFRKLFGKFSKKREQMKDKEHVYFKCPNCKKSLRVPRGKGTISIRCPKCGNEFIKRT